MPHFDDDEGAAVFGQDVDLIVPNPNIAVEKAPPERRNVFDNELLGERPDLGPRSCTVHHAVAIDRRPIAVSQKQIDSASDLLFRMDTKVQETEGSCVHVTDSIARIQVCRRAGRVTNAGRVRAARFG